MEELREITLGVEALGYIKESLSGERLLSKTLRERLAIDSGRVRTYLPFDSSLEELNQFEHGGKLPESAERIPLSGGGYFVATPNLDDFLVPKIQEHLRIDSHSFCVFDDALLSPEDPAMTLHPEVHTFVCADTVCHYLGSADANSPGLIRLTLRFSSCGGPPYFLGCAGRLSSASPPMEKNILTTDLDRLAECTDTLFLGAYDGEGFLVWSK